jgi:hypothetical protein
LEKNNKRYLGNGTSDIADKQTPAGSDMVRFNLHGRGDWLNGDIFGPFFLRDALGHFFVSSFRVWGKENIKKRGYQESDDDMTGCVRTVVAFTITDMT